MTLPAAGGTVALLGGALRLVVPASALAGETYFEAALSTGHPGATLLVPGTALTVQAEPALVGSIELSLTYDDARLPHALRHEELRVYKLGGDFWRPVEGSAPAAEWTVSAAVDSLGTFALLGVPAAIVEVLPAQLRMRVGEEVAVTARVRDAAGNLLPGRAVSWLSAKPTVATVNHAGVVRAVGPGIGHIGATSQDAAGSNSVVVEGDL
ncbi:MAG: Ig-like domain-containing protein [Gemmatimonadota bacterium]